MIFICKYPKTYHVPWSEGITDYDRKIGKPIFNRALLNKEVVVTEKMDGENTTIYKNYLHPRSVVYSSHPSRDWLKSYASTFQFKLEEEMRICGENLYAKHSIHYKELENYFLVFSVWKRNLCLSWDETLSLCKELQLNLVPVIYRGEYDYYKIHQAYYNYVAPLGKEVEGYVIRPTSSFEYNEFKNNVFKYVRKNHIKTDEHWLQQPIIKNQVINER